MGGLGSGGGNRRSVDDHRRRGTWRRDRHAAKESSLPAEFRADARAIVRRLLAFADRFMTEAEKARGKGAAKSVSSAIKCLTTAMAIARGLGDATKPPIPNGLNEHLARRPEVVRLPTAKEGERQ